MVLRISGNVLLSEDGQRLKEISCPRRMSLSALTVRVDRNFECENCTKLVVNTDFLTEDEVVELLQAAPDSCLYINLMNPIFKVEKDV